MRCLFVALLCGSAFASNPVLLQWSVDTSGIEKISKTISFDTLHLDSTHYSLDTVTTIEWVGSVVFSCQDSINDSMGVFIDVNAGTDTIPADSVWGITTAFPGNNLRTFFSFRTSQKHWTGEIPTRVRLTLDNQLLGYNRKPKITSQPVSLTVLSGQQCRFSVMAVADPAPAYSWMFNGKVIGGANSPEYLIPAADTAAAGKYWAVVSNKMGTVTSDTALLVVNVGALIIVQPQSQNVTAGQSVSFSVIAAGNPSPQYQWRKNGATILGATSASFSIASAAASDTGAYSVVVSNGIKNDTSASAHLTVDFVPAILVQPQSVALTVGQSVLFSVGGEGNPAPAFQWRKNGSNINGATLSTYSIASAQTSDTGAYSVVLTNTLGSATSADAILALSFPPSILIQPQSHRARIGQSARFVVKATGNPAPTYQWKLNGSIVAGATDTAFVIRSAWVVDTGKYTVTVANDIGSIISDTATFGFDTASGITTDSLLTIAGGTFQMGQAGIAEPVHSVTLTTFKISNTLVTQREFRRVMGISPSVFTGDPSMPVENVTWFDAALYCNSRSKMEGKDTVYSYTSSVGTPGNGDTLLGSLTIDETRNGYRLPNEAEYEFACRAGTSQTYYWGNSYPPISPADTAAIDSNAVWSHGSNGHTWPVASKKPNPWGLYDVVGQVQQWQNDWTGAYTSDAQTDPIGPASGTTRIVRGGSWSAYNDASDLRTSARKGGYVPKDRSSIVGFRVVIR